MQEMRKYPIGIQTFKKIRTENYLYIDKTKYIYRLIKKSGYFFLSRPRRFGKSLLISTLEAIFLNQKSLFEGLWIEDKIEWKTYPVIRLDFLPMDYAFQPLDQAILRHLQRIAKHYQIDIQATTLKNYFYDLIQQLSNTHGKVVILIDEYDKPIIDYLDETELKQAQTNRAILKQFYGVIKSLDDHIQFFFLTGVSRFSKVSIFSDLNNLDDISMTPSTQALIGYTQQELEAYFSEEIIQLANNENSTKEKILDKIQNWYNGYRWDAKSETVYNPFSVLSLMRHHRFMNFWFETGTPTFLLKLLRNQQLYDMSQVEVDAFSLKSYEIENLNIFTLLFQTGYLTIADRPNDFIYELTYPNAEVKHSFEQYLLSYYAEQNNTTTLCYKIARAFQQNKLDEVVQLFNTLLAHIPYDMFEAKQEKYYQAIFYLSLKLIGYYVETEIKTNLGRIDAVVQTETGIFIIEFKVNQSAEKAIQQIKDKKYYEKYQYQEKKICLIGMNCYDKAVQEWITDWI